MNYRRSYFIRLVSCFFCIVLVTMATMASAETITVVTDDFPPYEYKAGGAVTGISTEVVRTVLQKLGMDADIRIYPWARAYKMALRQKNVLIYSINRLEERENLFKWVGIVAPYELWLYKLKERKDILITSLKDLNNYRIGGMRKDSGPQFLMQHGFKVREFNSNEEVIKNLSWRKTVDIITYSPISFVYKIKELNLDPDVFEQAYHLRDFPGELYMAFSLKTEDALVEKFRQELKTLKQDGTYDRILRKYFGAE